MRNRLMFSNLIRLYWLARGKKINSIYRTLMANQRLDENALRALQLEKLKRLVSHAYRTVPYYRRVFDEAGLSPADIRTLEDFTRLPVLRKSDVRNNQDDLVSTSSDRDRIVRSSTGGSTGEPVHFCHSREYRQFSDAIIMRYWGWAGWRLGENVAWIWGAPQETSTLSTMKGSFLWWLNRRKLLDAFNMDENNMSEWVAELKAYRPRFINGYATSLTTFARFLMDSGTRLEGVEGVFSTAEKLFPQQRETIEKAFGCKVYDHYGSREIFGISAECPEGGMHINSDIVHVEFEPMDNGDLCKLIVTCLDNYAMPLLRYEIGDSGLPSDRKCSCGLPFPLMELKVGRVTDNFITPARRVVHGEYFTHLMYGITGVASFQFRQVKHDLIELYIIRDDSFDEDTELKVRNVVEAIRKEFDMNVKAEYVGHIPLTVSGKHRFTVNELAI